MRKNWTKFLQASVIAAAVFCSTIPVCAEDEVQENTKQHIYLSQMAKYKALSKEFKQEIEATAHPRTGLSEGENPFLWQLEDYKKLNVEFADTFAQNVSPREVPATPEEIYLWQLKEYKELDKTFYNEHRREF